MVDVQRFPLSWPAGWRRHAGPRLPAKFHGFSNLAAVGGGTRSYKRPLTTAEALARIRRELDRLGAANVVISTNVALRLDGLPYSGQKEPDDPGAAVYFLLDDAPRCLACDLWNRTADNLAAIAGHVAALRAVDRYGVGTVGQAFAGYAALPPAASDWRAILGLGASPTREEVLDAHRLLASRNHPDRGGNEAEMARINAARDAALREVWT